MASNNQFTRIDTIFPNREEAIEKLNSLSLPFATGVCVRYKVKESDGFDCECHCHGDFSDSSVRLILAVYITDTPGDYAIISDSDLDIEAMLNGGLVVYQGTISNGQTAEEAIKATLFGTEPKENNIVILLNKQEGVSESYIYIGRRWVCLGKEQAPVQYSNQFEFSEETRDLKIKQIHGGTF